MPRDLQKGLLPIPQRMVGSRLRIRSRGLELGLHVARALMTASRGLAPISPSNLASSPTPSHPSFTPLPIRKHYHYRTKSCRPLIVMNSHDLLTMAVVTCTTEVMTM